MANRVEISKRLIFINSLAGIALDVANLGVLVWLYRHLLHRISQEEFALYPVVASVTAFLPLLTVVLSSGLGRYTLVAYAKGDERRVTQIVSTMFPLHLALGVLVLVTGGIFAWHIDQVLTIPPARVADARLMMLLTVLSFSVASGDPVSGRLSHPPENRPAERHGSDARGRPYRAAVCPGARRESACAVDRGLDRGRHGAVAHRHDDPLPAAGPGPGLSAP
jgi:hypothetical protein